MAFKDGEDVGLRRNFFQKIFKTFFNQILKKRDAMLPATGSAKVSQTAYHCQIPCCIIKFCYS